MDNLEFRKFLTTYGIRYDEYKDMDKEERQKLLDTFKSETKTDNIGKIGQGLQGCGCLIMLIPILLVLLYFLFEIVKSLF